ncbi:hypothetical protein CPB85DRAFT_1329930 [Mucidula mucida]|nr:hypothetical protein CPB85DRAFT_1329930 [Mucidula mucida]
MFSSLSLFVADPTLRIEPSDSDSEVASSPPKYFLLGDEVWTDASISKVKWMTSSESSGHVGNNDEIGASKSTRLASCGRPSHKTALPTSPSSRICVFHGLHTVWLH